MTLAEAMMSPSLRSVRNSAPCTVYPKHVYRPSSRFFPAGVRSESNGSQKNCELAELMSSSPRAEPRAPYALNGSAAA